MSQAVKSDVAPRDEEQKLRPETPGISNAHARYVLGMLFVVYVFNFVDRQILNVVLVPIQNEIGAPDWQMGLLTGLAFAAFYTFAGIPLARWADKGNRVMIISLGIAVWSAMTALSGVVRSYAQLALARIGVGIGEATTSPAAHSLISDYFPPERRSRALAIYAIGANVGMLVGMAGGGAIAHNYGWRAAFLVLGLPGLAMALLVRLTVREPPRGMADGMTQSEERAYTTAEVLRYMWGLKSYRHLCIGASLLGLAGYGMMTWTPTFLMRSHGMNVQQAGIALGLIFCIGGAAGAYLGGYFCDKLSARNARWALWVPAIGAVGMMPFMAAFLLLPDKHAALISFFPGLIIGSLYVAPTFSTIQALARLQMRALAVAMFLFLLNLVGLGLGPSIVGILSDALRPMFGDDSLRYAMLIICGAIAWAIVHYLIGAKHLPGDLKKARQADVG